MVSQNNEAQIVIDYFNGYIGNLLDIGANDGKTFSNSYDLIQLGWEATLIEPVKECYDRICELYKDHYWNLHIRNFAVGKNTCMQNMFVPKDSLLSSAKIDVGNTEVRLTQFYTFLDACNTIPFYPIPIDFISIDAEGFDWEILQQIDLTELGCKCICVEYWTHLADITNYCAQHGLTKRLLKNGENIILAK